MSYNGNCNECGGNYGSHLHGCTYEGESGYGRRNSSYAHDGVRTVLLILAIIGMCICPPFGAFIFWIMLRV